MQKSILQALILAALASFWPLQSHSDTAAAELLADKMLARLGGREPWADLRNTINGSQQNRANEPTVVYAVLTIDFEQPRFRIETTARDLHLIRVVDGEKSWRLSMAGVIGDLGAERVSEEIAWYDAHVYRTIHRIAARDPALKLGVSDDGRLEVFDDRQGRLLWFRLDEKGEPYAFGFRDDETGSLCGPWDVIREGIRHPSWVSSADGSWRAAIKALEFNVPLHESMFARPVGLEEQD